MRLELHFRWSHRISGVLTAWYSLFLTSSWAFRHSSSRVRFPFFCNLTIVRNSSILHLHFESSDSTDSLSLVKFLKFLYSFSLVTLRFLFSMPRFFTLEVSSFTKFLWNCEWEFWLVETDSRVKSFLSYVMRYKFILRIIIPHFFSLQLPVSLFFFLWPSKLNFGYHNKMTYLHNFNFFH